MSKISFDFLADSFLLNESCIKNQYKDYTEDAIRNELEKYRAHCLTNLDALTSSVQNIDSNLKVVSRNDYVDFPRTLQSALYLENYLIYDPMFSLTAPENEIRTTAQKFFNQPKEKSLKESVLDTVKAIKFMQPLVAGGFMNMLPLSIHFEQSKEMPMYISGMSYDRGMIDMDYETRKYFVDGFRLKTFAKEGEKWTPSKDVASTRIINCSFGDYHSSTNYLYFDVVNIGDEENSNVFHGTIGRNAPMPSKEDFDKWIIWCLYATSMRTIQDIRKHISIANQLGAQPVVTSQFETGFLQLNSSDKAVTNTTAETLMNIELPFINRIDVDKLMKWRQDEVVFNNFRSKMEQYLRQARYITDPVELKRFHDDFIHEVTNVQLPQLNQKLRSLSAKFGRNFAISTTVGLMAAMQGGQFETATAIGTGVQALSSLWDYRAERRENPFFFLHKILS
jgi:hypothetical protein